MAILELKCTVTELRTQNLDLVIDYKQKRELANWKIGELKKKYLKLKHTEKQSMKIEKRVKKIHGTCWKSLIYG